jgi:hypothetical protein
LLGHLQLFKVYTYLALARAGGLGIKAQDAHLAAAEVHLLGRAIAIGRLDEACILQSAPVLAASTREPCAPRVVGHPVRNDLRHLVPFLSMEEHHTKPGEGLLAVHSQARVRFLTLGTRRPQRESSSTRHNKNDSLRGISSLQRTWRTVPGPLLLWTSVPRSSLAKERSWFALACQQRLLWVVSPGTDTR